MSQRCWECDDEPTAYLADLGIHAPSMPNGVQVGERCAAELRAEGLIKSIRTFKENPDA